MHARYFRYLFETGTDGIAQTGYVRDNIEGKSMFYLYLAGKSGRAKEISVRANRTLLDSLPEDPLDLVVLGAFTPEYILCLLQLLERQPIKTVIMPYIAPIQRLAVSQWLTENVPDHRKMMRFMQEPYRFLRGKGVEYVFFLAGNGRVLDGQMDMIKDGFYFEEADAQTLQQVAQMEGYQIPVLKAGYIVRGGWLYYFGHFGMSINDMFEYTGRYCSSLEYEKALDHPEYEQFHVRMKRLLDAYLSEFEVIPKETVTMYVGPLQDSPVKHDSLFTVKVYQKSQRCRVRTLEDQEGCAMKCLRYSDHDIIKHHTDKEREDACFGLLLLANLNLKEYMSQLVKRYHVIGHRIRALTLPNGGSRECWNSQLPAMFSGRDYHYWICSMDKVTSAETMKEIMMSSSYNRLLNSNQEFGVCFSGYLVPEIEY